MTEVCGAAGGLLEEEQLWLRKRSAENTMSESSSQWSAILPFYFEEMWINTLLYDEMQA